MGTLKIETTFGRQGNEPSAVQALRIFTTLKARSGSDKKIAILYSANDEQARKFHEAYKKTPQTLPSISGGGQAVVVAELIKLINKDKTLREGQIRILPIATSLRGDQNDLNNSVSVEDIQRDLGAIKQHLADGYDVFGIPKSDNLSQYAIGGSISKFWFTQDYTAIQCEGKPISQGEFVQIQLKGLADGDVEKFDRNFAEAIGSPAEPLSKRLKYDHATDLEKGRMHELRGSRHEFRPATTDGLTGLNEKYLYLTGDHLKTRILSDFKATLDEKKIATPEDVDKAFEQFKSSDEWKVLQKSQGITTAVLGFFHLKKTSSVLACEALVEEKKQNLSQEEPRQG